MIMITIFNLLKENSQTSLKNVILGKLFTNGWLSSRTFGKQFAKFSKSFKRIVQIVSVKLLSLIRHYRWQSHKAFSHKKNTHSVHKNIIKSVTHLRILSSRLPLVWWQIVKQRFCSLVFLCNFYLIGLVSLCKTFIGFKPSAPISFTKKPYRLWSVTDILCSNIIDFITLFEHCFFFPLKVIMTLNAAIKIELPTFIFSTKVLNRYSFVSACLVNS